MTQVATAFDKDGNEFVAVQCRNCEKFLPGPRRVLRAREEVIKKWPQLQQEIAAHRRAWFWLGATTLGSLFGSLVIAGVFAFAAFSEPLGLNLPWYTVFTNVDFNHGVINLIGSSTPDIMLILLFGMAWFGTGYLISDHQSNKFASKRLVSLGLPTWATFRSITLNPSELRKDDWRNFKTILLLPHNTAAA